jgi:hypothetical protein
VANEDIGTTATVEVVPQAVITTVQQISIRTAEQVVNATPIEQLVATDAPDKGVASRSPIQSVVTLIASQVIPS